ncbi:MAG: dienelactone hydrolase family protein [Betaproteobacteria bacterium]|nr:dienelactone hydrolase family protein [Betaproteobacteria bacterium]MBU6513109.1 dienelactone hydrolase family protein [Betaproteobacteria bacterium]MDE1955363.1 dienelactone hydrolase family protein [Betaproteobacteria bacterium]MDE2478839.1 dienelactone hydrolase family protein [Betaproteobacteria bacterium]
MDRSVSDLSATRVLARRTEVLVPARDAVLRGSLMVPEGARAIVVFAHGSGSSRLSPRNLRVAGSFEELGLATLLFDLLTPRESEVDELTRGLRFDIELLSRRLVDVVDWLRTSEALQGLAGRTGEAARAWIGLFGASTGAAAALTAAAQRADVVAAVVSRGGRPDLAGDWLPRVRAPTLLIVGGHDPEVIACNREAAEALRCAHELRIVPGATHLFQEPGTLAEVARLAGEWFVRHCA